MKLVFALVLVFISCVCASSTLFAIKGVSQEQVNEFINKEYDVRGFYGMNEGFALIFDFPRNELVNYDVQEIAQVTETENVLIVESNHKATSVSGCEDFATSSPFCHSNVCVLVYKILNEEKLYSCLAPELQLVSLPNHCIQLPSTLEGIAQTFTKSELIESLVSQVNIQLITQYLAQLTNIYTRQSQSTGAVEASDYLANLYLKYGWNVTRQAFRTGYSDNVIAEKVGQVDATKIVIVGAHYDDRARNASSSTDRAPGANDDGSGTAGLLEIARLLGNDTLNIAFTVRLVSFSGEEQDFYGSQAYANYVHSLGEDVVAMLQVDMIAYQPGTNATNFPLYFGAFNTTPDLTTNLDTLAREYVPQLTVGETFNCCSDEQSFWKKGQI